MASNLVDFLTAEDELLPEALSRAMLLALIRNPN